MGVRFDFRVPESLDFAGFLENSILIAVADEKHSNGFHLSISFCKELVFMRVCADFWYFIEISCTANLTS